VHSELSLPDGVDLGELIAALRSAGARFALAFGSRVPGLEPSNPVRTDSDLDVAAWWGGGAPDPWSVSVPVGVDLVVLDRSPLALAGRVAMGGVLLFDDDPPARVRWQADTRKRYVDERPRREQADADFSAAVRDG
jgi:hypothetical protein